jgi:hypothetical protein
MKIMTKLEKTFCASDLLERPRYYPRQLITPTEMTLEQNYFRDKMRRHNRLLHGWGVVCGAQVCLVPKPAQSDAEPWKVAIHPGYILGPDGDEILIDRERIVDLRTEGLISACGQPAGEADDPWCSDVFVRRREEDGVITLYVAVKYKEILSRPVRAQPANCGCNDTQCEFSRFCDGYEIGILNHCPDSHQNPPAVNLDELFATELRDCPACPIDPWVVLAKVVVDSTGVIQEIDNCHCRRIIVSFSRFWLQCAILSLDIVTATLAEAGGEQTLVLTGTGLFSVPAPTVNLGENIDVLSVTPNSAGTELTVVVDVHDNTAGTRYLRVAMPNCSTAIMPITITPKPPVAAGTVSEPKAEPPSRPVTKPPAKKAVERKGRKE